MKFNIENAPKELLDDDVAVGNVYNSKCKTITKFWVVVAIRGHQVIMLGMDDEGNITSSQTYGRHMFEDNQWTRGRKPIGRVVDLPSLEFKIEWSLM